MIRVMVELIRAGDGEVMHIGTAIIANDETGDMNFGNYSATFSQLGKPDRVWKFGNVKGFPREEREVWDLLYLALRTTVGSRNEATTREPFDLGDAQKLARTYVEACRGNRPLITIAQMGPLSVNCANLLPKALREIEALRDENDALYEQLAEANAKLIAISDASARPTKL